MHTSRAIRRRQFSLRSMLAATTGACILAAVIRLAPPDFIQNGIREIPQTLGSLVDFLLFGPLGLMLFLLSPIWLAELARIALRFRQKPK